MSRFIIPKGVDYTFTVQIMEEDSFLPQDVSDVNESTSTFKILNKSDGTVAKDASGIDVATVQVIKKSTSILTVAAKPEETQLTIAKVEYEKYIVTIKGQEYIVDNKTDIFSVVPQSSLPTVSGGAVSEVVIHSSLATHATVSNADGYYTMRDNYVVLTDLGAANATALTNYTVTVASKTSTSIAPTTSGSYDGDTLKSEADIAAAMRTAMKALPDGVTVNTVTATDASGTIPGSDVIVINEVNGGQAKVDKSSNIIQTKYTLGTPKKDSSWYDTNGYLTVTLPAIETAKLNVSKGASVDNYYLKSDYLGIIDLKFLTNTTLDRVARIQDIYVSYAGA